jgi:hypothetical protein
LDELSGVFAGRLNASSRASSDAMHASCVAIRSCAAASTTISASLFGVGQLAEVGRQDHSAFSIDSAVIVSRISCASPNRSLTIEPIASSTTAMLTQGEQIHIQQFWREQLLLTAMLERGLYDQGRFVIVARALMDVTGLG